MILPYICPEHPKGQVKHTWDSDIYENGRRLKKPKTHNHIYSCASCGRRLAATPQEGCDYPLAGKEADVSTPKNDAHQSTKNVDGGEGHENTGY